jgi:polysaccharide biosynthesis protein PslG
MGTAKIATALALAAALLAAVASAAGTASPSRRPGTVLPPQPPRTGGPPPPAPRSFFGIAPQAPLTATDAGYMQAAKIGGVRWPFPWNGIQPTAKGGYLWEGTDAIVATAAKRHLAVLPFLYGTPSWLASKPTALPVGSVRQRAAWSAFVGAAVERYGPRGSFWRQHRSGSREPLPKLPIRSWQIWNEANFFYFAFPVSPARYAKTLELAHAAVESVDPGAEVVLSGLFGEPEQHGSRGMPAARFLAALYRIPGIEADFDAAALHPYAVDAEALAELTEGVRETMVENGDRGAGLYVTEMGWGSQSNFRHDAFEQGVQGQVRELRRSYEFLLENRHRLDLKGAYWFSWQDLGESCDFCDSVGLFHAGSRLRPKPAWNAFVQITGGRPRP